MTLSRQDYIEFRDAAKKSRIQWIEEKFPEGVPVNWWIFLLDFVEADLSQFRTVDVSVRLGSVNFGADVIELAVSLGSISRLREVSMLARLGFRARQVLPVELLPAPLDAEYLVRRAISSMPLNQVEARLAAERRRAEFLEDSKSREAESLINAPVMQEDDGIKRLYEIEEMLDALEPLRSSVADPENRRVLAEWLSFRNLLGLHPPPE